MFKSSTIGCLSKFQHWWIVSHLTALFILCHFHHTRNSDQKFKIFPESSVSFEWPLKTKMFICAESSFSQAYLNNIVMNFAEILISYIKHYNQYCLMPSNLSIAKTIYVIEKNQNEFIWIPLNTHKFLVSFYLHVLKVKDIENSQLIFI